jgi:hypothetical protein
VRDRSRRVEMKLRMPMNMLLWLLSCFIVSYGNILLVIHDLAVVVFNISDF